MSCPDSLTRSWRHARASTRCSPRDTSARLSASPLDESAADLRDDPGDDPRTGSLPVRRPRGRGRWHDELGRVAGLKIGIAWQGNPDHKKDRHRSFRLDRFEPLSRIAGVRLFSLQKGLAPSSSARSPAAFPSSTWATELNSFMDTAAVIRNLDLVITPDTSLAHLAGALGVPVWVAVPFSADWRWLLEREDTPWYPTMRLFRQRRWDDWDEVFERIARDLHRLQPTA